MRLLSALGVLVAVACAPEPAPNDLRSVQIPPDFTFATSRAVTVVVAGSPESLGAAQAGILTLQLPDGGILYKGPLLAGRAVEVELVVPTKDATLWLELAVEGRATLQQEITLTDATVNVAL